MSSLNNLLQNTYDNIYTDEIATNTIVANENTDIQVLSDFNIISPAEFQINGNPITTVGDGLNYDPTNNVFHSFTIDNYNRDVSLYVQSTGPYGTLLSAELNSGVRQNLILYQNYSQNSPISGYKKWSQEILSNPEVFVQQSVSGLNTYEIAVFAIAQEDLNQTFISTGIFDIIQFANATASNRASIFCRLYHRSSGGVETLLGTSDEINITTQVPNIAEYQLSLAIAEQYPLNTGEYVVLKMYAKSISATSGVTVEYYYEGQAHYSSAITPFSIHALLANYYTKTESDLKFMQKINVSTPLQIFGNMKGPIGPTIMMPNSSTIQDGYLSATNFSTFSNKENVLSFSSPLSRVSNTISANFSAANSNSDNILSYSNGVYTLNSTNISTTNITEGTKLFYTDVRFDNRLATKTTTNLTEGSNLYYTDTRSRAAISANTNGLTYNNSNGVFSLALSSGSTTGALSASDFSNFSNKENILSFSSPLTRVSNTISIPQATSIASGYLTSSDWSNFNNKISSQWLSSSGSNIYFDTGLVRIGQSLGIGIQNPIYDLYIYKPDKAIICLDNTTGSSPDNSSVLFLRDVATNKFGDFSYSPSGNFELNNNNATGKFLINKQTEVTGNFACSATGTFGQVRSTGNMTCQGSLLTANNGFVANTANITTSLGLTTMNSNSIAQNLNIGTNSLLTTQITLGNSNCSLIINNGSLDVNGSYDGSGQSILIDTLHSQNGIYAGKTPVSSMPYPSTNENVLYGYRTGPTGCYLRVESDATYNSGIRMGGPTGTSDHRIYHNDSNDTLNFDWGPTGLAQFNSNRSATIGTAKLGLWSADNAFCYFQHSSLADTLGNYALIQENNGNTYINAATSRTIQLKNNNSTVVTVTSSSVGVGGNTNPSSELSLSNNLAKKKMTIYDVTNNDHQYAGLGYTGTDFVFQGPSISSDFLFSLGTSTTTSSTVGRLDSAGLSLSGGILCLGNSSQTATPTTLRTSYASNVGGIPLYTYFLGRGFEVDPSSGIITYPSDGVNRTSSGVAFTTSSINFHTNSTAGAVSATGAYSGFTDMILNSSGNIGLGTESPNYQFHIHRSTTSTDVRMQFTDGTTTSGGAKGFQIIKANNQHCYVANYEFTPLYFFTNGLERGRFEADGNFVLQNSLKFQNGGNSNLGHYEEALLNTTFSGGAGGTNATVNVKCIRIGKTVTISIPAFSLTAGTSALPNINNVASNLLASNFRPTERAGASVIGRAGGNPVNARLDVLTSGELRIYRDVIGTSYTASSVNNGVEILANITYNIN